MTSLNSVKYTAAALIGTVSSLFLANLISKYGVQGALRYIWEGDHHPPEIREAIDELDEIEEMQIPKILSKIDKIQVIIQTAYLNSVDIDTNTPSTIQKKEILNSLPPQSFSNLKKKIAMASHELDRIAADIDSIRSYGNAELKSQKKNFSSLIVSLMKPVDEYMDLCS